MAKTNLTGEGAFTSTERLAINNGFDDISYCTTQTDVTSSTTLVNITGMVTDVLQPGTYRFTIHLTGTSGASGGTKVAFSFGTASMLTSIEACSKAYTASAVAVTRANTATNQASLQAATAANIAVDISGVLVVAAAGTLQLQIAQNASNATATSVYANGSYMFFKKIA